MLAEPCFGPLQACPSGLSLVQSFVETAEEVDSLRTLQTMIEDASRELGFDYFAIVHHVRFGQPSPGHVRLTNYPAEWLAFIRERGRPPDPVFRAAERTSRGFKWQQLSELLALTAAEQDHLRRAARHDLIKGFTVPNHVPGQAFGSCNFAVKGLRPFPDDRVSAAQALGNFAFDAARRLVAADDRASESYINPAPLSDRQRECLLFVARGKSDSVIGQLLGIRPRTVNEHIEAAKRRYAVATRSQLLVRALFRSEICFSEVLA